MVPLERQQKLGWKTNCLQKMCGAHPTLLPGTHWLVAWEWEHHGARAFLVRRAPSIAESEVASLVSAGSSHEPLPDLDLDKPRTWTYDPEGADGDLFLDILSLYED